MEKFKPSIPNKKSKKFNKLKILTPFVDCLNGNQFSKKNNDTQPNSKSSTRAKSLITNKTKFINKTPSQQKYISFISSKNSSSLFLDHTFVTSKNMVLSQLQSQNLFAQNNIKRSSLTKSKTNNFMQPEFSIKTFLKDLKKTYELNMDIISNFYNKDKQILSLIQKINQKISNKKEIYEKIEKIKGTMIIEKQIQSESIRKTAENEESFKEQINLSLDKISMKDEYIIILLKKLKELEIYSKRKSAIIGSGFEKHKNFTVAEFVDVSTKCNRQKNNICTEINTIKKNIFDIKKENKFYKNEENLIKKKNSNKNLSEDNKKIQKTIKYYKNNISNLNSRIQIIKNSLKQISKKNFLLNVTPKLKELIDDEIDKTEKNKVEKKTNEISKNINSKNQYFGKRNLIHNISASIDLTTMNNDMTKRLESFIDLSVILNDNKNNDISNIIDTTTHGNIVVKKANFGNISKISNA